MGKKKNNYKRYVVVNTKKAGLIFYDIWDEEIQHYFSNTYASYSITKDKRLYVKVEYEEVDDWYADLGYITHTEKFRQYLGKVKYASNNMLTILNNCYLNNCLLYFSQNPEIGFEMIDKLDEKTFKNVVKIKLNSKKLHKDKVRTFTKLPDEWYAAWRGKGLYWTEREDQYVAN